MYLIMIYSYIAIELMSIAMLSILIYANVFETKHHTKRKNYFLNFLIVDLSLCFADLVTYLDLNWAKLTTFLWVLYLITYVFSFVVLLVFAEYLFVYISEKTEVKRWHVILTRIYSLVLCGISIVTSINGKLFYVVDGVWQPGEFETTYYVFYLISLIYLVVITSFYAKKLGLHDFITALSFVLLPLISIIISTFTGLNFAAAMIALDALIIYIMLESDKEDTLIYWSNYDELTGLFNRRSYESDLSEMKKKEVSSNLVFIAVDVNGLKQVNDNIGHDAGDEIIIGAGKALKTVFGSYGKVYRVGGDEFVTIINVEEQELKSLKDELENEVNRFEGKTIDTLSISTGYATKREYPEATIDVLAKIADDRMYSDKTLYYQKNGIDRRSQKDAHKVLCESYNKILKVNLTNDSVQIIDLDASEKDENKGYSEKISIWLKSFADLGNVYPDDLKEYLEKTDINYIKDYFLNGNKKLRLFYRRKYDDQFKYTMLEVVPTKDYKKENQVMYFYVKQIEE